MSDVISQISVTVLAVVVYVFTYRCFNHVYTKRYSSPLPYIIAFALALIIARIINQLNIAVLNLVITYALFNILSFVLYKSSFKRKVLHNIIIYFIPFFAELVSSSIWSIATNELGYLEAFSNTYMLVISNLLNIMLLLPLYKAYFTFVKNDDLQMLPYSEVLVLLLMTLFEFFVLGQFFLRMQTRSDGIIMIILMIGFLLLNAFISVIIGRLASEYKNKYELKLARMQNDIQLTHYNEMNSKYKESRKAIHDIKRHIDVITALQGTDPERAKKYGSKVYKELDQLFTDFKCSNEILSIIMSQKIILAESEHIKVTTEVEDLLLDFMVDTDVTAIFANLWDNAIEASRKVKQGDRYIKMQMYRSGGFIAIEMENSFDGKVSVRNSKLVSTKLNHEGVGIKIIQSAVSKYEGMYSTSFKDNDFKTHITIPIKQD